MYGKVTYTYTKARRIIIVHVNKEELAERHQERRRARKMAQLCRFGGIYFGNARVQEKVML